MSEKTHVWHVVRDGMRGLWKATRVEARYPAGIPDVCFEHGWMELKWSPRAAKKGRVQTLPHFKPEQRRFLQDWDNAFLLWRVGDEWFLFDNFFDLIGHVPIANLHKLALAHWNGPPVWPHLAAKLNVRSPV